MSHAVVQLLVALSLVSSTAAASDVEVTMSCPPYDGVAGNDPALGALVQPNAIALPLGPTCAIYIGNNTGGVVESLDLNLSFPTATATLVSPALLPDGLPGLTTGGPPYDYTWDFTDHGVKVPVGFPAATFDADTDLATWNLTDLPPGTRELRFSIPLEWSRAYYRADFPAGDYDLELTAAVDGEPLDGTRVVPMEVNKHGRGPGILVTAPAVTATDGKLTGLVHAGRRAGFSSSVSQFEAQTNAQIVAYLPYWDGVDFLADGEFNPLIHTTAVDLGTLEAEGILREYRGSMGLPEDLFTFDPVTVGTSLWTGPAEGPNAHFRFQYDPATNAITATFGAFGPTRSDFNADPGNHHWGGVRWAADINPAVMGDVTPGIQIPVAGCVRSDQAVSTLGRQSDPLLDTSDWCNTRLTTVEAQEEPYTSHTYTGSGESHALQPTQRVSTGLSCQNTTSQERDYEMFVQLPGRDAAQSSFESLHINQQSAYGPDAGGLIEIYASETPSDYGSVGDLNGRVLPATDPGDWVLCNSGVESPRCTTNDLIAAGLDPELVQELRVVFQDQKPDVMGLGNAFRSCSASMTWQLHADVPSSINETQPCGTAGDTFDNADMTLSAVGSKATFVSTFESGAVETRHHTWNAELSSATRFSGCQFYASNSSGSNVTNCSGGIKSALLGDYRNWAATFRNSSTTLDNMFAPYAMCWTIPYGFLVANERDPVDPYRPSIWHYDGGSYNLVSLDRYTYTWAPSSRELCIDIPHRGDPADPLDTLAAGNFFSVNMRGVLIPGADRQLRSSNGWFTYNGYDTCGTLQEFNQNAGVGGWDLVLVPGVDVSGSPNVTEIGEGTEFCYDIEIYNNAWDDDEVISNPNAGSARGGAVYQIIPKTGKFPGVDGGDADSVFVSADPIHAGSTWITTAELDPDTFGGATSLDPAHADPDTDFIHCTDAPAVCDGAAADAALAGTGYTSEDVEWVAFDIGEVPVTDAEPWGQAPIEGNSRIAVPVTAQVCMAEAGSANGAVLRTITEFRSSDTADAASAAADFDVRFNELCPPGSFAQPELCNGVDDNCSGFVDDGLTAPLGTLQNGSCEGSLQICTGVGGWVDPDYSGDDPDGDGLCVSFCRAGDSPDAAVCDGVCNVADEALSPDCDTCGADLDSDGDTVCDPVDQCPGFSDLADANANGVPDACDPCGNSILDPGEACDDGNLTPLDGCSEHCQVDAGEGPDPIDCDGGGDPHAPRDMDEGNMVIWGSTRRGHFGRDASNIGDFDGDGFEDLAVSAYHDDTASNDAGSVHIWFGPLTDEITTAQEADVILYGDVGDHAGFAINSAGDLDNDGRDDLLIGGWDERDRRQGKVWLVYGQSNPPAVVDLAVDADATFISPVIGDDFGAEVNGLGDVNDDGVPDFAIGAPKDDASATGAGAVYLFLGGAYLGEVDASTADVVYQGLNAFANAGERVEPVGDLNGDGVADFAIGSPRDSTGGSRAGAAFIFYGGPALATGTLLLDTAADATMYGNSFDRVGHGLAAAGDVTGDGLDDLWVGAPFYGSSRRGAVYLLAGGRALSGPVLLESIWTARYIGRDAADQFGGDIASGFDADNDGHLDVVVGAIQADSTDVVATGAAWILFGPHSGTTPVGEMGRRQGLVRRGKAGAAVAGFADANQDGFGDVVITDRRIRVDGVGSRTGMASAFFGGEIGDPGFVWYADRDGDGWGDEAITVPSCQRPDGYIARPGDCDDTNADVHPYATENHCGLSIDFNCDGHVGPIDVDGDGWFACEGDCDEGDLTVNKGGVELCDDNVDNDCNGQVDGGDSSDAVTYYPDGDGDGYGSPLLAVSSCDEPDLFLGGVVFAGGDCNDADFSISPEGVEVCDGVDNNCDDVVDEDSALDAAVWHIDVDGDGFGDMFDHVRACTRPAGHSPNGTDCDDLVGSVNPAAPEICDTLDNNCDGGRYLGGHTTVADTTWLAAEGAAAGDRFGESVAVVGDLDGDGREEVFIGASQADLGGNNTGVAYLRYSESYGGSLDFGAMDEGRPAWDVRFTTERANSKLGETLASGDFNGDGVTDLVIGAPEMARPGRQSGGVFVLYGPFVDPEVDVESADIIVGGSSNGDLLGRGLDVADLDGDNLDDLVLGAPGADEAYVIYGSALTSGSIEDVASATLTGPPGSDFGRHVAAVGDVDGDGWPDMAAGAPLWGDLEQGQLHVLHGDVAPWSGPQTASVILSGDSALHRVGLSLDGVGDVDGDGADDLLLGGNGNRAWLLLGGIRWAGGAVSSASHAIFYGDFSASLGRMVHGPGDIDGDGRPDMVIGGPRDRVGGSNAGVVWVVYGADSYPGAVRGADLETRGVVEGGSTRSFINSGGVHGALVTGSPADELGRYLGSGDLDGNGLPDLLLGAPKAHSGRGRAVAVLAGHYGVDVHGASFSGVLAGDQSDWYLDSDFDGQASPDQTAFTACWMHVPMDRTHPADPVLGAVLDVSLITDCDDTSASTYTGAAELSLTDGIDSNCDGADGYSGSPPNNPPTTPGVEIVGLPGLAAGNDLVCRLTSESVDADGDDVTYGFSWTLPGDGDADGDHMPNANDVYLFDRSHWDHVLDFSDSAQVLGWNYLWYDAAGGVESLEWGPTLSGGTGWTCEDCDEASIRADGITPSTFADAWTSVEWTSPADGDVRLAAEISRPGTGGDGVRVKVDVAGVVVYDAVLTETDVEVVDGVYAVLGGDRIRVQVQADTTDTVDDAVVLEAVVTRLYPGLDSDVDGIDDDDDLCPYGPDTDGNGNGLADACEEVVYDAASDAAVHSTVAGLDVLEGSTWTCEVTPFDGTAAGSAGSATLSVP